MVQRLPMLKVTLEPFDLRRAGGMLRRWLVQPHVAQWWGAADRAMRHASASGADSHALIAVDGTPVGYLCWRRLTTDELQAADLADLAGGLVDIDILIGAPGLLGQGVGSRALELLLARLRGGRAAAHAGVGTSASNARAIRCFEKAGFRLHRDFQDAEWGPVKYLVIDVHPS